MAVGNDFWSLFSLVMYLFSFHLLSKGVRRGTAGNIVVAAFVIITVLFSLLNSSYFIANWFTGVGFDDSIFYHLKFGVEGAGFGDFYSLMVGFVLFNLIFLASLFMFLKAYFKSIEAPLKIPAVIKAGLVIFSAFFCAPAASNLAAYLFTSQTADDFKEYFVPPHYPDVVDKPKNIIYFYLEGLERNYMDEELFPGLVPSLHRIEKESASFTNVGQTIGGSWTMAGMVSSQCGLPLLSVFTNNHFYMKSFLPNAVCLGDVLKSKGYNLEFMGGAEMEFAGKGLFYQNHGFASVKGKNEFMKDNLNKDYLNNWGLYDDSLYEQILKRIKTLHKSSTPWGMFSINIGTHQPEGYLAKQCENVKYGDGSDRLLNAVHCTDQLLGKMYDALKDEGILKDTVVVFATDHLAPVMVKPYQTLIKKARHNIFMVAGAGVQPGSNARHGLTLDVASTLLNYLQYGSHPVGLGRDLNGSQKTLAESFGDQSTLDGKLVSWRTIIDMAFWGYPQLKGSLIADPKTQQIVVGDKTIKFPSLIRYTSTGDIQEVTYDSDNITSAKDNRFLPAFYLVNLTNNNQLFLWVDKCSILSTFNADLIKYKDRYCFYNGSLASVNSQSGVISPEGTTINLSLGDVKPFSASQANGLRKALAEKNLIKWDEVLLKSQKTSSFPFASLTAAGRDSLLQPTNLSGKRINGQGLYLTRFTYTQDTNVGVTYYVDILSKLPDCNDNSLPSSLSKVIEEEPLDDKHSLLFYAVVGNFESQCKKRTGELFTDPSVTNYSDLKIGTPFIAILDENKRLIYSKSGEADDTLGLGINFNENQ